MLGRSTAHTVAVNRAVSAAASGGAWDAALALLRAAGALADAVTANASIAACQKARRDCMWPEGF